jgi:hypothetical protein
MDHLVDPFKNKRGWTEWLRKQIVLLENKIFCNSVIFKPAYTPKNKAIVHWSKIWDQFKNWRIRW